LLLAGVSTAQTLKVTCSEKERKQKGDEFPDLITTCFIKNFKFVHTSYPDYVGRYFESEEEVYIYQNKRYVKTTNSNVFNKNQAELLSIINEKIQKDFKKFRADSTVKWCFTEIDTIPIYKMNDLEISFQNNEIWFDVEWHSPGACGPVSGTTVIFKLNEIEKYIK